MPPIKMAVLGDIINACKHSDTVSNLRLNTWNAKADNFGIMLNLGGPMIYRIE
jgi:hypothetical protein